MHLREIVRSKKSEIKIGTAWRTGKVDRKDFPMARKAYALGSSYRWNVINFQSALGCECRVLVIVNAPKQKYEAILGVMAGDGNLRILCTYEYHPSEPGWHCHATHDDASTLTASYMRGPWIKRVPGPRKLHRDTKFSKFVIGQDDKMAIRFAVDRYKIHEKGSLL